MISGWLILDKPLDITSTKLGNIVRRLLGAKKIGHAGTLDPLATGVLPLAIGEATKTIPYCVYRKKSYRFQITWGENRATEDAEGEVTKVSSVRPERQEIVAALPQFIGEISQVPPIYSAVKVDGQRSYALARSGQDVVLKSRLITVYNLSLLSIDSVDQCTLELECGAGTYVRSIARDLAVTLNTCGYVSALRRTQTGKFTEKDTISLEKVYDIAHNIEQAQSFLPIGAVLDDIPAVPVSEADVVKLRQGMKIQSDLIFNIGETVAVWQDKQLIAMAYYDEHWLYPKRIFNI
jgi:tRNA pseudouridine55 synthase